MEAIDWANIEEGEEIEPTVKPAIEKKQLVKYAGASGDFNMIHTDEETARQAGLPGVIAHGMLSMGFLGEYAANIIGTQGFVSWLNVRFNGMVLLGDVLTCRAKVIEINEVDRRVRVSVSAEKDSGKVVTSGEAVISYY